MGSLLPSARPTPALVLSHHKFAEIQNSLCLDTSNIQGLYESFRLIDSRDRSYFDLDDFVAYFRRDIDNFVELPFAQRLFRCIPKASPNKIFFQEFARGISAFCLLNNEGLLHFVFDYIDIDGDERISKEDMEKLADFRDPVSGEYCFFTNFKEDLKRFRMKENQTKIDFDYFRMNYEKLTFLVWPAFSLQEFLREKNLGTEFWFELYAKVEKRQNEMKNNEKKGLRIRQKLEVLKNMKNRPNIGCTLRDQVNERTPNEIADDCKLLRRSKRPRRKSACYVKPQLTLQRDQFEAQKNEATASKSNLTAM